MNKHKSIFGTDILHFFKDSNQALKAALELREKVQDYNINNPEKNMKITNYAIT